MRLSREQTCYEVKKTSVDRAPKKVYSTAHYSLSVANAVVAGIRTLTRKAFAPRCSSFGCFGIYWSMQRIRAMSDLRRTRIGRRNPGSTFQKLPRNLLGCCYTISTISFTLIDTCLIVHNSWFPTTTRTIRTASTCTGMFVNGWSVRVGFRGYCYSTTVVFRNNPVSMRRDTIVDSRKPLWGILWYTKAGQSARRKREIIQIGNGSSYWGWKK